MLTPRRVLVVDDDEESAELLERVIGRRGHDVRVAHDVEQALRTARAFEPEVVLLDIMIRCESGYFLARELRELPNLESVRIVAMTGFTREQLRRTSAAAGFYEHLTKPVEYGALFDALEASEALAPPLRAAP